MCVDLKSPHAYLALAPTLALADELGIEVDWLPLVVPPLVRHPEPGPGADRGSRHRWHRARYYERDLERQAEARRLELRDPYRAPDSTLAALALLWVKARSPESLPAFLESVFEQYWRGALDIEDASALTKRLAEIGASAEGFEPYARGPGRAEREALDVALRSAGAFGVPTYWVGGEPFNGRQHLPMIRRLLIGSQA